MSADVATAHHDVVNDVDDNRSDNDDSSLYDVSDDDDSFGHASDQEYADLADVLEPGVGATTHHVNILKERIYKFQDHMDLSDADRRIRNKDKSDRATVDRALDDRTLKILYKMMAQGLFTEINGVISSGKESNVYYASSDVGDDLAVKVYMTSILQFRNRDQYVTGDWRLRGGYTKSSSWKKVRVWAEKEYRNLLRIRQCGRIPCPEPLRIKGVVLVMSLIGDHGQAAPRLKDASICSREEWDELYAELALQLRVLFQQCSLIHADFSEYNVLYHRGHAYMIDVSQSVEHNHPKALDFLRADCHNLNLFFQKQGVCTLTLRELFDFIVDPVIPKENTAEQACLRALLQSAQERPSSFDSSADDLAFKQMFLPRNLDAVINFTRDQRLVKSGRLMAEDVPYASIIGLKNDLSGPKTVEDLAPLATASDTLEAVDQNSGDDEPADADADDDEDEKKGVVPAHHVRPRDESASSKRERKLLVKEEQREKRKTKIKKHEKKRMEKQSRRHG